MAKQWRREERHELDSWAEERDSLWRIALGPLIWALHFVVSYGGASVVCAKIVGGAAAEPILAIGMAAITLPALLGIGWVGWRSWRQWDYLDDYDYEHDKAIEEDRHEFLGHAAFLLAVVSFVAVIYVALPVVFTAACH